MSVALSPEILAHLVPARRLEERHGHRPSGVALLDQLLGGGWPRAALAELRGRRSSGRTALLYASLASSIGAAHWIHGRPRRRASCCRAFCGFDRRRRKGSKRPISWSARAVSIWWR